MPKYVYIIETTSESFKAIKIGIATNPAVRLCELQTACPLSLRLAASYANRALPAERIERLFHNILKPYRISGEWFALGAAEALQIIANDDSRFEPFKKPILFKHLRVIRQKRQKLPNNFNKLIGKRVNWLDRYLAERR